MPNKWLDRTQPQTLQSATILMYVNAVLWLITFRFSLFHYLGFILVIGPVLGGLGIANEKKWGYWVGVAVTALAVLFFVAYLGFGTVFSLIIYIALLALLLHPMSRNYYRTWFR